MTTVIFAFAMAWEEAEETGADAASCAEPVSYTHLAAPSGTSDQTHAWAGHTRASRNW